jgi:hypothetical protein
MGAVGERADRDACSGRLSQPPRSIRSIDGEPKDSRLLGAQLSHADVGVGGKAPQFELGIAPGFEHGSTRWQV